MDINFIILFPWLYRVNSKFPLFRKVVVDINHQILTIVECWGFRPRGKICNMVMALIDVIL